MTVLERMKLDGMNAVVTGASRGIGRGVALALAEAGANVAIAARGSDALEAAAQEIRRLERKAIAVQTDAADPEQVAALAARAREELGSIDIWVNNAGGQPDMKQRPFIAVTRENFDAQVDLNLKSVWAGVLEASKAMTSGGSIINISSLAAAHGPHTGHALYGAAKAAVNSLTASLAVELGPTIRVNAVAPGPILTDTFYETMELTPKQAEDLLPSIGIPLQRYGTPEDVAAAVVFLASPAAAWISGTCLYVTGGLS